MKNIINMAIMAVGVILLLATESQSGISNMIGLSMVWYEAQRMGIFYK